MEVISAIEQRDFLLPLFQRPFVWTEDQVCDLFDSVLRGYPLGNILLLEKVPPDLEGRLRCCNFLSEVGIDPRGTLPKQNRAESQSLESFPQSYLVLDGQQRLYAFWIGLNGSYLRKVQGGEGYEKQHLYFDLRHFVAGALEHPGGRDGPAQHYGFIFYSEERFRNALEDSSFPRLARQAPLLFRMGIFRNWPMDRCNIRRELRAYLKDLEGLSTDLLEELEDILGQLYMCLWRSELIHNRYVSPPDSYGLLSIFSRLNQGASFNSADLSYAISIVFPDRVPDYTFSRFIQNEEPAGGIEPPEERPEEAFPPVVYDPAELENYYEELHSRAVQLNVDMEFFYQCYLFAEEKDLQALTGNLKNRGETLGLRNDAPRLLRFYNCADRLAEVLESTNFILKRWFAGRLSEPYTLFPVYYYLYQQADDFTDSLEKLDIVDLSRIIRWIALSEIKQNLFVGGVRNSGAVWSLLHGILEKSLHGSPSPRFPLGAFAGELKRHFPGERELSLEDQEVERLLQTDSSQEICMAVIALLYSEPQRIHLMEDFEERLFDDIQPRKLLTRRECRKMGLPGKEVSWFVEQSRNVANLQWLPHRFKSEKGDIPFSQWLENSRQLQTLGEQNHWNQQTLQTNFLRFHRIPMDKKLFQRQHFREMIEKRWENLRQVLKLYGRRFDDWDLQAKSKMRNIPYRAF